MNISTRIKLVLLVGLSLSVIVLGTASQSTPQPTGPCGGCTCILPGSVVTLDDGECGITEPGGDTVLAIGGPVTVSTDLFSNAITAVAIASGARADLSIASPGPAIAVIGGNGAFLDVGGSGLTLDVDMPGGLVTVTGTGHTVIDGNVSGMPTRYESLEPGPASSTLELSGHQGSTVVGPWYVNP